MYRLHKQYSEKSCNIQHLSDQRFARYFNFPHIKNIILYLMCTYLSVHTNIMDRLNHLICHLIFHPVVPDALSNPFSSLPNTTYCTYNLKKYPTSHQYFTFLIVIQHCCWLWNSGIVKCNSPLRQLQLTDIPESSIAGYSNF